MSIRNDTWMAFYVGDYLGDTLHLAREHHGSYLLLILAAFRNDGWLPNDDCFLAQIAKCTPKQWKAERHVYARFFVLSDDRWIHNRVTRELERSLEITAKRQRAGLASAAKRQQSANTCSTHVADVLEQSAIPLQSQTQTETEVKAAAASSSVPCALAEVDEAFALWSALARDLQIPDTGFLNGDRRAALHGRLNEIGGLDGWALALEKVRAAEFFFDDNGKPKRWLNLGWLLKPENFTGLMEGRYAERHRNDRQQSGLGAALAGLA